MSYAFSPAARAARRATRALLALACLGAVALAPSAVAQSNVGTTTGQFLLIEPSGRLAAMGNAGVTTADEASAAYFNPAALGALGRSDAQFTHSAWLADIDFDHAVVAVDLGGFGTVMGSATVLRSGDIDVRTVEQPLGTGEQFDATSTALTLGYGRQITDRFSAGAQVALVNESIYRSSLSTVGLSFGVRYELGLGGPVLGASLMNLGPRSSFDGIDLSIRYDEDPDTAGDNSALPGRLTTDSYSLPTLFRVGVAWPVEVGRDSRVTALVDASQPSDNTESVSLGGEWMWRETLAVRAGYQNLFQDEAEGGLTLGGGLQTRLGGTALRFDYAWNDFGRIGDAQRFTLGVSF